MKPLASFAILALALSLTAAAQPPQDASPATPAQKESNAASATEDTSGTTGDQISHPAGAKGSTLIGCLAGPGKYMLRSMSHRLGVEIVGSDDLKKDSGSKVKLTGVWQPLDPLQQPTPQRPGHAPAAETHRFQATQVEVMEKICKPPSETTPVSKNKAQKPTVYNAPSNNPPSPK